MTQAFEQLTVNLTERSARALELAAAETGLSKTDCVNRAIQAYAWLEREVAAGRTLCVRDAAGELTDVRFTPEAPGRPEDAGDSKMFSS